jgi:hypothetical protein
MDANIPVIYAYQPKSKWVLQFSFIFVLLAGMMTPVQPVLAEGANAIESLAGCMDNSLNVESHYAGPIVLGFTIDFAGQSWAELFVNDNGTVTFGQSYADPSGQPRNQPTIAPYLDYYPSRGLGEAITWGQTTYKGHAAFCVNWIGMQSNYPPGLHNSFQLVLVDRSDEAMGTFDMVFNYDTLNWEAAEQFASRVGYYPSAFVFSEFQVPAFGWVHFWTVTVVELPPD